MLYDGAVVSDEYMAANAECGNGAANTSEVTAKWSTLRLSTTDIFTHVEADRSRPSRIKARCDGRRKIGCGTKAMVLAKIGDA